MLRAVEEAAFSEKDLRAGRALARAGAVGSITVSDGGAVAAVTDGHDAYTVEVTVPVLDESDAAAFTELVAAESGRIGALLAGQLPHAFVEAVEEAGVELLPYGGELGSACTCDAWLDPCPHALAVLTQLAWLIQVDPFVLTHLRGLSRDRVLRDLHRITAPRATAPHPGPAIPPEPGSGRRRRGGRPRRGRGRRGPCGPAAGAGPPVRRLVSDPRAHVSRSQWCRHHIPGAVRRRPCPCARRAPRRGGAGRGRRR